MTYLCPFCTSTFDGMNLLFAHMKLKHSERFNDAVQCKQAQCLRTFGNTYSLKKHLKTKHEQAPVVSSGQITQRSLELDSPDILEDLSENNETVLDTDCNTDQIETVSVNDVKAAVHDAATSFIAKLYSNPNISRAVIQVIIENTTELFGSCGVDLLKQALSDKNVIDEQLDEMLNAVANPFVGLDTEYFRQKHLTTVEYLIPPSPFTITTVPCRKTRGSDEILTLKNCTGQFIPMRAVLKKYLMLPNVYKSIIDYMARMKTIGNGKFASFVNGSLWTDLEAKFGGKTVLPLTIYFDDLEINNPLGSHAGVNKIGVIYYKITSLPPEYASMKENILLASIHKAVDRKAVDGNNLKEVFKPILEELAFLEEQGIEIIANGCTKRVHFVTVIVSGDNLGLHMLFGLHESFSSNHYCRFCREHKTVMQTQTKENRKMLRTVENYSKDLNNFENGLKQECLFNALPSFHLVENLYADLMHDFAEGIDRYVIPAILNQLINVKSFLSLHLLNQRIKYFDYGCTVSNKNIPPLKESDLQKGHFICSASEMSYLVKMLGLMIGDLIPRGDKFWQLYIKLREITCILTRETVDETDLDRLDKLLTEHHTNYQKLIGKNLTPKFHFALHYVRVIKCIGPLGPVSTIRFESRHKDLKEHAEVIRSRTNICYSLALKNQLMLSERFHAQRGFGERLKTGPSEGTMLSALKEFDTLKKNVPNTFWEEDFIRTKWVEINGTKYMENMVLMVEQNDNVQAFGKIKYILILNDKVLFLFQKLKTVVFDEHYHAFRITPTEEWGIVMQNCLPDYKPRDLHSIADGYDYINC